MARRGDDVSERERRSSRAPLPAVACVFLVPLSSLACVCGPLARTPADSSTRVRTAVIGKSVRGRAIEVVVLGSGARRVLYLGGVHGDEYGTDVLRGFVAHLKADADAVPHGAEAHIIECLNPDGRVRWSRGNARGVDLNRNMPTRDWSAKLHTRDRATQRGTHGGKSPGSEPEVRALISYLTKGFAVVVSVHSRGGIVDYDGPGSRRLAQRVAAESGLRVAHLDYQEVVTGSLGRFVPERHGAPALTVEVRGPQCSTRIVAGLLSCLRE